MNRAILVKSCQRFRSRREEIEETWADSLRGRCTRVWFVEGGWVELDSDDDGVLRLNEGDKYSDNSEKLRRALCYLMPRDDFTHLFIVDDDTFVHPRRWLAHEPQGDLECRLFQPRTEAEKKRNHGRPWISGGSGWWMSRRMCELYVEHCHERSSQDDVIAARIAQDNGIEIVDRPDLYAADRYSHGREVPHHLCRVSVENRLITSHHVSPVEMVKLWEETRGL